MSPEELDEAQPADSFEDLKIIIIISNNNNI